MIHLSKKVLFIILFLGLFTVTPAVFCNSKGLTFLGPSGGGGGQYYANKKQSDWRLVEVRVRSGAFIDAIQTVHENVIGQKYVSKRFGGGGGNLEVFTLAAGEHITRISGKYGNFVDSLQIETNTGRVKGWGGVGGAVNYTYSAPAGTHIYGFFGRSGAFIDSIGVILKSP